MAMVVTFGRIKALAVYAPMMDKYPMVVVEEYADRYRRAGAPHNALIVRPIELPGISCFVQNRFNWSANKPQILGILQQLAKLTRCGETGSPFCPLSQY